MSQRDLGAYTRCEWISRSKVIRKLDDNLGRLRQEVEDRRTLAELTGTAGWSLPDSVAAQLYKLLRAGS